MVLAGVARGCGWQHLVVFINLGTFYLIGMVVAALLGFKTNLHAKVILKCISMHALFLAGLVESIAEIPGHSG